LLVAVVVAQHVSWIQWAALVAQVDIEQHLELQ
jgi:hypothetical protein